MESCWCRCSLHGASPRSSRPFSLRARQALGQLGQLGLQVLHLLRCRRGSDGQHLEIAALLGPLQAQEAMTLHQLRPPVPQLRLAVVELLLGFQIGEGAVPLVACRSFRTKVQKASSRRQARCAPPVEWLEHVVCGLSRRASLHVACPTYLHRTRCANRPIYLSSRGDLIDDICCLASLQSPSVPCQDAFHVFIPICTCCPWRLAQPTVRRRSLNCCAAAAEAHSNDRATSPRVAEPLNNFVFMGIIELGF